MVHWGGPHSFSKIGENGVWVRYGTQVPTTLINVYYNVQAEAIVATFVCYIACIKAVIGMLGLLGTSGALFLGGGGIADPLAGADP